MWYAKRLMGQCMGTSSCGMTLGPVSACSHSGHHIYSAAHRTAGHRTRALLGRWEVGLSLVMGQSCAGASPCESIVRVPTSQTCPRWKIRSRKGEAGVLGVGPANAARDEGVGMGLCGKTQWLNLAEMFQPQWISDVHVSRNQGELFLLLLRNMMGRNLVIFFSFIHWFIFLWMIVTVQPEKLM